MVSHDIGLHVHYLANSVVVVEFIVILPFIAFAEVDITAGLLICQLAYREMLPLYHELTVVSAPRLSAAVSMGP
jgi:hypothetical protein